MLHFCLQEPVELLWFGEFISPAKNWRHLTRRLFEYEMMAVTEGELYIGDGQEEYCVREGEYLIMSPTENQHGTRECTCRFYWMHFRCPALPASVSLPVHGKYADPAALSSLAAMLLDAEREAARSVRSRYLATAMLLELCRGQKTEEGTHTSGERLCEAVKNFVFFHRFSELRVRDIAKEMGYHEKYLSAVFHAQEGVTLKQYLVRARLDEAKRLLAESDYTVAQISYLLNFPSPHNFSRFFKQAAGVTAGQYRKSPS